MSRTVDESRPGEIRDAIVRYLIKHGLSGLSLRPLARALGCTPRVLLYHFGSKERMVTEVLAEVRQQQRASYDRLQAVTFADACQEIWKRMSAPDSEPLFRLFFEAYGIALRNPRQYKAFLRDTIEAWLQVITDGLIHEGYPQKEARVMATIVLAGLRGFLLDVCTTHDRERVDRAVSMWLASLDFIRTAAKRTRS